MPCHNLDKIRKFLLTKLGLDFGKNRDKELLSKLTEASKSFKFKDTKKFIDWLLAQPMNEEQTKLLAGTLTIGETYFFRERKALDYLEYVYLPILISKRRGKSKQLKIWCAGCATGEEPYSIAILLQKLIPDYKNWDIAIFATDINPNFIAKAKKGVYSQWSFRQTSESFKTNYFEKLENNSYKIKDSIKEMVTFSFLNLAQDTYPSPRNNTNNFDVILCRNVLIYFSAKGINNVVSKFYRTVKKNGILLVSPVETSSLLSSKFGNISYRGYTVFKKGIDNKTEINKKEERNKYSKQLNDYQKSFKIYLELPDKQKPQVKPIQKEEFIHSPNLKLKEDPKINEFLKTSYEEALKLYNSSKLDEAKILLKNLVVNKDKRLKSCLLLLAKVYANKGQLAKSESVCKKTIGIDKINVEAHYLLSTILSEQEKTNEAIESLNNTIFLDPNFALAHFLLGNIKTKTGNIRESNKHFQNALKSLKKFNTEEILDESDGLTAGRLAEVIHSILKIKQHAEAS